MKLIVGLGNPGDKYTNTRHNAGFMVLDYLRNKLGASNWKMESKHNAEMARVGEVLLAKPQTYMNDSGKSVSSIVRFFKILPQDIYIVHDDLDITLGNYKIQYGKGPQVHNGLLSIEELMGTDQFWHVRIGVENREVRGNKGIPGVEYSLQNFAPNEKVIIDDIVLQVVERLIDTC